MSLTEPLMDSKIPPPSSPLLDHLNRDQPIAVYTSPPEDPSISKQKIQRLAPISESQSEDSEHALPAGTSSIFGVYQNFLNALVGAGILGIPFVYAQCGIIGGIGLMVIFALLSTYTMNLLIQTAQKYRVTEYEELGRVTFGSVGYIASASALFLLDFGSCLTYLIILGDATFSVVEIWDVHFEGLRQLSIAVVSIAIIFPPCLWRDISFYERLSAIKLVGVGAVLAVVVFQWVQYRVRMTHESDGADFDHKWTPETIIWFDWEGIPGAVGIVAYCFVAHDTAFLYYNTLSRPTTMRWSQTVLLSVGSAMILSLILSIAAYFTFGSEVDKDVLNNYSVHDPSIITTRIIYVVMMALTFPTAFFVVRHVVYAACCRLVSLVRVQQFRKNVRRSEYKRINSDFDRRSVSVSSVSSAVNSEPARPMMVVEVKVFMENLFRGEYNVKNAPLSHHVATTCTLFFFALGLSMVITDLGTAMNVIGSLSSLQLAFLMPCLMHIKASPYGFGSCVTEERWSGKWNAFLDIYPPLFLAVMGVCLAILGVVDASGVDIGGRKGNY